MNFILRTLVKNFRMGLATNSSSSHSLVFFNEPRPGHDTAENVAHMEVEFGWDQFKLTTLREKLMYALVAKLRETGFSSWSSEDDMDLSEAFEDFGHLFPEFGLPEFQAASHGYIDHQSQENSSLLIDAARNSHAEIWGGNDNDGDPHDDNRDWDSANGEVVYPDWYGINQVEYLG